MFKRLLLLSIVFILGLSIAYAVKGEEATTPDSAALDEQVSASELGVSDQKILPDSNFYFLKEWGRGIKLFFTFDKVKKAELESSFANEKLDELKKLVEANKDTFVIEKATQNYENSVKKVKSLSDDIKEKAADDPDVSKFLDKYTKQQILHQKILNKLENQVPPQALSKIKEATDRHLENFKDVMLKLEDKDKIGDKIESILNNQSGSDFKDIKSLEILKKIQDKMPEIKDRLEQAEENITERVKNKIQSLTPEEAERLKTYINSLSNDGEKKLEIFNDIKERITNNPELVEKLNEIRQTILDKTLLRNEQKDCPAVSKPSPDFCKNGKIQPNKSDKGCIIGFRCVVPSSTGDTNDPDNRTQVCTEIYDPVCGKDGKTYSNKCFAAIAKVEVASKGVCGTTECKADSDCPVIQCIKAPCPVSKCVEGKCKITEVNTCNTLWWHDNTTTTCQQKQFCGAYMYLGLKTFKTEAECKASLTGCKTLWWYDNEHKTCQQKEFCGTYMYLGLKTFDTEVKCNASLFTTTAQ